MGDARRRLALGLLLAGVLSATVALLAQASGILDATEQRAVSARFAIRGASVPADIVVVAIDDATFDRLGQQWPFPRSMHGRLIEVLHAAGAREIVYDVQFTEPTSEREDNALFAALQRTRGAVLATSVSDDRGRTSVLGGDENVRAARSVAAAANLPAGHGGVLDHVTYATGALKSLAVVTSARAGVPPPSSRAFGARGAWIDFRGPPGTITTIPFASVLRREVSPAAFRDKIVIVGASAPSLQDVHPTPTAAEPMAGAEIEANAIWTVMRGLPLRDAPAFYNVALLLLVAFTVPLLRIRLTVLSSALAGPAVVILVLAGAQVAFDQGSVTWVSAPVLAAVLSTVLMVIASHLSETAVRRHIARDNDTLELKVRERTQELRQAQLEILERLSRAAEGRDEDTGAHVARIGRLSHRLAQELGLPEDEAEAIGHAAVAHDIGKIAVPDRILLKRGELDDAERHEIQRHALVGAAILSDSRTKVIQLAETIARTHHEHWDGSGYPRGLTGEETPLAGRICGLVDVFDALVSERPYKKGWPLEKTLDELRAQSGKHFDPRLIEAFVARAPALYAELYSAASSAPRSDGERPQTSTGVVSRP